MNLFSPSAIKELLAKYGAAPLKSLGQNFLISHGVVEKIIQAAELKEDDVILEIGPGLGALTGRLAQNAKKVIAVEKDKKYSNILKETLSEFKNIEIIHGDALYIDIVNIFHSVIPANAGIQFKQEASGSRIPPPHKATEGRGEPGMTEKIKYKLVSNLPYNITSPVIRKFLEKESQPELMVLTIQKEVARRICAKPPEMSLLAVSVQFFGRPQIIDYVSKGNFWPQPQVDSAILKIAPRLLYQNIDISKFFAVVRAGFSAPRKQLAPNLASKLKISRRKAEEVLKSADIKPEQRAETLNAEDWVKIVTNF